MKKINLFLAIIFLAGLSSVQAAEVTSGSPAEGSTVENPVRFQFTPRCDTDCGSASLQVNTTGNLSLTWKKSSWTNTEISDLEAVNGGLELKSPGERGSLNYSHYTTNDYYNVNGHPDTENELDEFFNTQNQGVNLSDTGVHEGEIHWYDGSQWNEKPEYLPGDRYSWKASGYLFVPENGTYTFGIDSDDASDLFIDGEKVTSFYGGHAISGSYGNTGELFLERGQHRFTVRMEEGTEDDGVSVAWMKPGESSFNVISADKFSRRSLKHDSRGSFETEPRKLETPVHWIDSEVNAEEPNGTDIRLDYATKRPGGWRYYDRLSQVPETKVLKINGTLNTSDPYSTPRLESIELDYVTPADTEFYWKKDSNSEWEEGEEGLTAVRNGKLQLRRNATGQSQALRYTWYDTSGLNERNGYAENLEEMNTFFNSSTEGVKLEGEGIHEGRVHWHDSQWDQKPGYLPPDQYAWKASGYIYAPNTGTYTFGIDSDDASDLSIDGKTVTSYYGPHGTSGSYGHQDDIYLEEGYHSIRIRMQEDTGGDGVSVAWIRPNKDSFQVIPKQRFFTRRYQSEANYTSEIRYTEKEVTWSLEKLEASSGPETSVQTFYGYNSSGTWEWKNSTEDVPETKHFRYRIQLSTEADQRTPEVDALNLSYRNSETSFRTLETTEQVKNSTTNNLTYDFSAYSLPEEIAWRIKLRESNGETATSDTSRANVEPQSYREPDIEWSKPQIDAEKEAPVTFRFRPTCYSPYGCYEASLLFNRTGEKQKMIHTQEKTWEDGEAANITPVNGGLKLKASPGTQGELTYRWFDTSGLNSIDQYANSESEMDKFFDNRRSGVSLNGTGKYSGAVHWHNSQWKAKPGYLPSGRYSWKASGYLYAPNTGTYTFGIDSDDGSDLFIDGEKVASYYGPHGTSGNYGHSGEITLEKGYHSIEVRMQEATGSDGVSVAWIRPNKDSFEVIPANRYYTRKRESHGTYRSPAVSRDKKVELLEASRDIRKPSGTDLNVKYQARISGSWRNYSVIDEVPQTREFRYFIEMSTEDTRTPVLRKINISYRDLEEFGKRKSINEVYNDTEEAFSFEFLKYDLPQTFRTVLTVRQSDGQFTRSDPRKLRIKFSGVKVRLSWEDRSENEIGYRILSNATGSWKKGGETSRNTETYIDRNSEIEDGEYVCYRVKAFNTAGVSEPVQGCSTFTRE